MEENELTKKAESTIVKPQNIETRWNNNLLQSGKAGEYVRIAFPSLRHTKEEQEHGKVGMWVIER